MNRIVVLLIALVVAGCASHEDAPVNVSGFDGQAVESRAVNTVGAASGPVTAQYLTERYLNKANMCRNNPSAPAFLCSGVLLRATQHSTQFHFWNPNPAATGVSFSYLRADAKFSKLVFGYNNGFIFYPVFYAPVDKVDPEILCFFPVDGGTDNRGEQGCGERPGYPSSRECQSQGINTAAQYIAHYNSIPSKYSLLCGFNVRDSLNQGATTAFNEAIKAQGMGGTFAFNTQNEFRLAKWAQNMGKTLPVEAVFYINDVGKAGAQYDQRDFKTQTGIWIPMIRITLPQTTTANVIFQFIPDDQAISS
ncbi:hypothetical protein KVG95_19720 [Pseudomonas sp. SWRI79]|uniref:Halovibrin HvnA n=1 Tax=Pseudomonas farris TaxID=2841207 RepID=A0ABS6PZ64_9PSED|nr:hypothetical protein [Pseudomonas farris]MBV4465559.1 hypothetical protein [Pseudomonas farris]